MDYFLLNKPSDFQRGIMERVRYENGGLCTNETGSGQPGIFISAILDSLEPQTRWHRMFANLTLPPNTAAEIRIYGTNREEERADADSVMRAAAYSGEERLLQLNRFLKLKLMNRGEALLSQVTCRYLWLAVLLWDNGADSPRISGIQLFFPWESLVSWLPELYASEPGGFLERYLAIFQTIYQEADQKIRRFPSLLDPEAADGEALLWLARWIAADNLHSWPLERLKRYLSGGAAVLGGRGTKRGIKQMVYLYTGFMPYIIEPSDNPGEFLLLISQDAVPSYQEYQALLRVVHEVKPAHMEVRLVVLKSAVSLDRGAYLGVNSVIQPYPPAVLGQMCQADYTTLGG